MKTIKAPDYHDDRIAGSMDIDQPNEPVMVEENHGQVPSPIAPDHDPVVEHKKVSRKLMIKARDSRTVRSPDLVVRVGPSYLFFFALV